jgi:hypothetical protein
LKILAKIVSIPYLCTNQIVYSKLDKMRKIFVDVRMHNITMQSCQVNILDGLKFIAIPAGKRLDS